MSSKGQVTPHRVPCEGAEKESFPSVMSEVSTDFLRAGNPPPIHLFVHLFIHSFDRQLLSAYYLLDTHRGTEGSSEEG